MRLSAAAYATHIPTAALVRSVPIIIGTIYFLAAPRFQEPWIVRNETWASATYYVEIYLASGMTRFCCDVRTRNLVLQEREGNRDLERPTR
ncbi:hypothetical protein BCON_0241g00090 [Botryotinia convoluta]|uniref:Uncharacterized protein n=1 Tax=Botryotinia convoluta TaxID=54673 RepID=A0A4Z1HHM2_9HELO|nr:hypothetical protein BCON_0241g00090 [Botryotinia convoluta]